MKGNGHGRTLDVMLEAAAEREARATPRGARPGLLAWLRRFRRDRRREFVVYDPATGEWHRV